MQKARMRFVAQAVLALASAPKGFTASDIADKVWALSGKTHAEFGPTRAAYGLRKLRGKQVIEKVGKSRRYQAVTEGLRAVAATLVVREQVIKPVLGSVSYTTATMNPDPSKSIEDHYEQVRAGMNGLLASLGMAA